MSAWKVDSIGVVTYFDQEFQRDCQICRVPDYDDDGQKKFAQQIVAVPEMIEALQLLRKAIHAAGLLDVRKQFDLCLAEAAASKALFKAGVL